MVGGARWLYEHEVEWPVEEVMPDEAVVSTEQKRTSYTHQKVM